MALVEPDFSEVAEDLGPGTYRVQIVGSEVGTWQSGTPYAKWTMETLGEADPKNNGRKIFTSTPTRGKGAFRLQQLYRAATGEPLESKFDTEQLHGRQLVVEVVQQIDRQTGEATQYTEVKSFRKAD